MIRTGRALFTAHTNADIARPRSVRRAGRSAGARGGRRAGPGRLGSGLDKWVVFVPAENSDAVRAAMFAAGAGQIGDYSHCSWSVAGTGQFLPHDGADPAIGSVGAVERVAEDRVEVIAPATLRAHVLAAVRAAHPYEEPAFDVFALAAMPGDIGLGRIGTLPHPNRCRRSSPGFAPHCPATTWGVRPPVSRGAGVAGRGVRRCGGLAARGGRRRRRAGLRHRRSAPPSRRRAPAGLGCRARRRRALGQRVPVVRPGG